MRVVELTAFHVRIPLVRPFRHASYARTETENLVVRCVLEDGTTGYGEGVPREYVTGETAPSAIALLKRSEIGPQLGSCRDFGEVIRAAEALRLAAVPGDDRECAGNAARCAVELAFLDAQGRRFGEALSRVTREAAPGLYEPKDSVRYSGAIGSARQGAKLALAWGRMRVYRFRQVKVKVGIAGHDDVYRLRTIRRWLGPRVDLRVDANEAWPAAEAARRIQDLEPFGITSVEQPVAHANVGALAEVRRQVRTPLMLDESLCGRVDAERARDARTSDLFNLRLSKCGGFLPTLRLAEFARANGLGYQLGCQVGESALLSAAGRHFACSVGGLRYLEGSYDRHLVRESLGTRDVTFGWGGKAPALAGPGLGVEVDPAALERVTIRKETILG